MQYDTFKALCESTRVKPQMDSTGYGSQLMLVYWEILSEGNKRGGPVPISCTKLKKKLVPQVKCTLKIILHTNNLK